MRPLRTMLVLVAVTATTTAAAFAHRDPDPLAAQEPSGIAPASPDDWAYGVGAGDVTARSAVLWSRAGRAGTIVLEVARDTAFRRAVRRYRLRARPAADFTVQRRVTGLAPETRHHYRFRRGRRASEVGTFVTAARPDDQRAVRFAITGDADATHAPGTTEPGYGRFRTLGAMAAERNDFNVLNGDTIFSDSNVGGRVVGLDLVPRFFAESREQKWGHYRAGLELADYQALRRAAGLYTHWDDHEFDNDFTIPTGGRAQYEAGMRAFRDYTPVRYSHELGLYRHVRWGRHLDVFFLDRRSFSDAIASAGGACDNPRTGMPDKLPTAPAAVRLRFAVAQPELLAPVPAACRALIDSPDRTLLGRAQLERFAADLRASDATFKVVVTQPLHEFYANPYDRWEGYAHERAKLIELLREDDSATLVLSNDTHAHMVHEVMSRTLEPDGPRRSGVLEVSTGPNAASPHAKQINDASGSQIGATALNEGLYAAPLPLGVGIGCSQLDVRGYAQVEVTSRRLTVHLRDEHGDPIRGHDGRACAAAVVHPE